MNKIEFENYLRTNGLQSLSQFSIHQKDHPTLPICILDYDQFESPRFNEIVEKCRGTIVDKGSLSIVGKPFDRFYNVGEGDRLPTFPCAATEKLDGSLCVVYHYQNEWRVNSRFSWGDFTFEGAPLTFAQSVRNLLGDTLSQMNTRYTYIFEYVSPYNQVVVHYPHESVYLIGLVEMDFGNELCRDEVAEEASRLALNYPKRYEFADSNELHHFINSFENEGVVIEPTQSNYKWVSPRLKLKTETYLRLHKLKAGISGNLSSFLELWAAGEVESTLFLLPQYTEKFRAYQTDVDGMIAHIHNVFEGIRGIDTQKDFAQEALKYPFSSILFHLRKGAQLSEMGGLTKVLEKVLSSMRNRS